MTDAQEIKARIDLVAYVERFVSLNRAGRYLKACCPFHDEKTPSFMIDPDKQTWRCYGACAEGGDLFDFAMKQQGWSFTEALTELAREAGIELKHKHGDTKESAYIQRLKGLVKVAMGIFHENLMQDAGAHVRQYLNQRGVTDDTISRYRLGYALPGWTSMLIRLRELGYDDEDVVTVGLAGKSQRGRVYDYFRDRLIIPIFDERGEPAGFGARTLADEHPKYLNSPESPLFHKGEMLYGLHMARDQIRRSGEVVIVEGYMDVLKAHQAGFMNVVAQMGTATTEQQLKALSPRIARRVIIALDGDEAGQNASRRTLEAAQQVLMASYNGSGVVDVRIVEIPDGDPDDVISRDPDEWAQLIKASKTAVKYVIDAETRDIPENASVQEREQIAKRVLPFLQSPDPLFTRTNILSLAARLRLPEFALIERMQSTIMATSSRQTGKQVTQEVNPMPRSEAQTLQVFLEDATNYFRVNRKLAEQGIPKLKPGDFSDDRAIIIMQLFLQALSQFEDPLNLVESYDSSLLQLLQVSGRPPGDGIGYVLSYEIAFVVKRIAIAREIEETVLRSTEVTDDTLTLRLMELVKLRDKFG